MLNLDEFERMTAEECWDRFGWGTESKPGTVAYHYSDGDIDVFVNETIVNYGPNDDDVFACEIERDGEFWSDGFGNTPEKALNVALAEM